MRSDSYHFDSPRNVADQLNGGLRTLNRGVDTPYSVKMRGGIFQRYAINGEARYRISYWFDKNRWFVYTDRHGNVLSNKTQAEKLLEKISEEIELKTHNPWAYQPESKNAFSFQNLAIKYLAYKKSLVPSELGEEWYKKIEFFFTQHLNPFFGHLDVREIKYHTLNELVVELPWKGKTLKNCITSLMTFFKWAYKGEFINRIPDSPKIKAEKPKIKWVDKDTQNLVLDYVQPHHRDFVHSNIRLGDRPGEVRALRVKDFCPKTGTIIVSSALDAKTNLKSTKTGDIRRQLLPEELIEVFIRNTKDKHPEAFIFTLPNGRPYTRNRTWKVIGTAIKKAGLKITPYQLCRHSVLTQAAISGVDFSIIQEYAGHTNSSTTKKYVDLKALSLSISQPTGTIHQLKKTKK